MQSDFCEEKRIEDYFKNKYIIYGIGSVSERFTNILEKHRCMENILGYAVSKLKGASPSTFHGKKVNVIDQYPVDINIVIAVHISNYEEVKSVLDRKGYKHYRWMYPDFFNLCYGTSCRKNIEIKVKDEVEKISSTYVHVIILLAIENKLGKNFIGGNLYVKYMESFSEKETAQARLRDFEKRIEKCQTYGFKQENNIYVGDGVVLDGAHRLMLAYVFGGNTIKADVYDVSWNEYIQLSYMTALTDDKMQTIFNEEEVRIIKNRYAEIRSGDNEKTRDCGSI